MPLVATLLVISTLAAVGVDALLASMAPVHWFKRTLAFLAAPALLLLIPAYEPFLVLVLEGATVAAGVAWWRRWKARGAVKRVEASNEELRESDRAQPIGAELASPRRSVQFRVSTLLYLMALCGMAGAVAARLPENDFESWQSIIVVGVAGGLVTLLGAWTATRRWWMIAPALVIAVLIGIAPALADWFVYGIAMAEWPPDPSSALAQVMPDAGAEVVWLLIIPITMMVVYALTGFARVYRRCQRRSIWRYAAAALLVVLGIVVALPASYVLFRMLTPEPIPQVQLPQPNGYDELVAAGRLSEHTLANSQNFDPDTAKPHEVAQAATEAEPALALARSALKLECLAPIDYTSADNLSMESIQLLRSLARAIAATGQFHAARGERADSLAAYLDIVQIGVKCRRGGMLVDGIVGCAITSIGQAGLYHQVAQLSPDQCRTTIARLRELESECEPFEDQYRRDRIWSAHAMGWAGRLCQILDDIEEFDGEGILGPKSFDHSMPSRLERARTELLIAELTLRAFVVEQGRTPSSWDEVVTAGGLQLAVDPFDAAGAPLRYMLSEAGPLLYSVGANGVDDGGAKLDPNVHLFYSETGDVRLGDLFKP